jgi:hypothetical protein
MQKSFTVVCAMFGWVGLAQAQQAFQITGIDASAMTRANLCASLGGKRQPAVLVIRHSQIAGTKITEKYSTIHHTAATSIMAQQL